MATHDAKKGGTPAAGSVPVTIGGRTYRLRGSDAAALRRVAADVDATLASLAGPDREPDDFKLAVLTALNIAGEADAARAAWREQAEALRQRAGELVARLERLAARLPDADAEDASSG